MNKIILNENCKRILGILHEKKRYDSVISEKGDIDYLIVNGLISGTKLFGDTYSALELTVFGNAYINWNPKLEVPSIWDDKKYIITTGIAIASLIISLIAILK